MMKDYPASAPGGEGHKPTVGRLKPARMEQAVVASDVSGTGTGAFPMIFLAYVNVKP